MIRNAHAILIAGDNVQPPFGPTPNAELAIDIVLDDLRARFGDRLTYRKLVRSPTAQQVIEAFTELRPGIERGDLFVVMFAGHGADATADHPAQSWQLAHHQQIDDVELAQLLLTLPAQTDIVVISDCCFSQRSFVAGARVRHLPKALVEIELEELSHAFPVQIQQALARHLDSPVVCISAAVDLVRLPRLDDLAAATVAAADRCSYADLRGQLDAERRRGRSFHIDARPLRRLADTVLSSSRRAPRVAAERSAPRGRAVGSSRPAGSRRQPIDERSEAQRRERAPGRRKRSAGRTT